MGNYTTFLMFENPRRGRQARNFTENDPKILDLKSSSEQIIFRKLSLGAPVYINNGYEHVEAWDSCGPFEVVACPLIDSISCKQNKTIQFFRVCQVTNFLGFV